MKKYSIFIGLTVVFSSLLHGALVPYKGVAVQASSYGEETAFERWGNDLMVVDIAPTNVVSPVQVTPIVEHDDLFQALMQGTLGFAEIQRLSYGESLEATSYILNKINGTDTTRFRIPGTSFLVNSGQPFYLEPVQVLTIIEQLVAHAWDGAYKASVIPWKAHLYTNSIYNPLTQSLVNKNEYLKNPDKYAGITAYLLFITNPNAPYLASIDLRNPKQYLPGIDNGGDVKNNSWCSDEKYSDLEKAAFSLAGSVVAKGITSAGEAITKEPTKTEKENAAKKEAAKKDGEEKKPSFGQKIKTGAKEVGSQAGTTLVKEGSKVGADQAQKAFVGLSKSKKAQYLHCEFHSKDGHLFCLLRNGGCAGAIADYKTWMRCPTTLDVSFASGYLQKNGAGTFYCPIN